MVFETRKQSMAWMEHGLQISLNHFRWKIKWWLELLGALGIMGITAPSALCPELQIIDRACIFILYRYTGILLIQSS